MRRGSSTVEELYAQAVALAERGAALEPHAQDLASRDAARQCFQDAVRIFNRLAIVESAAQRAVVQGVVRDLRARIAGLEEAVPSVERQLPEPQPQPEPPRADEDQPHDAEPEMDALTTAMGIHQQARDAEEAGDRAACIELYLSAGDWYMKAFGALGPEAKTTKDAVREQIEYVIEHVSKLKADKAPDPSKAVVTSQEASTVVSLDDMHWPAPPEESPVLAAMTGSEPIPVALPPATGPQALEDAAWPMPPLAPTLAVQSGTSQSLVSAHENGEAGMAWPMPPGAEHEFETFDWPMAPVAQPSKRRSSRALIPPSRTSSRDQLPVSRQSSANSIQPHSAPVDDEAEVYSPAELDVLRRSSQINGHIFVPWLDNLDSHENFRLVNLFVDPDGMVPLSAKQIRKGAKWMRPSEYAQLCAQVPVMIDSICPQVVKQDIVTDCSFVASLCIAAAYEQRFQK